MYVVPKANIDNTLAASGYPPDSALNAADLMELSKQLHGEYVLDGKVTKAGPGNAVRFDVRVLLHRREHAGAAAAAGGRQGSGRCGEYGRAVDQRDDQGHADVPHVHRQPPRAEERRRRRRRARGHRRLSELGAVAHLPAQRVHEREGIARFDHRRRQPDSDLRSGEHVGAVNLADAYAQKGDKDKAIETNLKIYRVDPSNTAVAQSIVQQLAQSGAPDKALPIIDSLIKDNPADVGMFRTKWLLLLNAKKFKEAYVASDEYIKLAPDSASADFYNRMIGVAQTDSNATKVQEFAAKGRRNSRRKSPF